MNKSRKKREESKMMLMGDGMRDYSRLYEVGISVYFVFFVYFEDWLWEWYGVGNFFDYDI